MLSVLRRQREGVRAMTLLARLLIAWVIALPIIVGVKGVRDDRRDELDRLRCYAQPSTTYYDGELGYRLPQFDDFHSTLSCWPKNGCFLTTNGDALCWRVARVKPR